MIPEWYDRVEGKLDRLGDRLGDVDKTLAAQHVSLEHHIKRTDLLEKQIAPLQRTRAEFSGVTKIFGAAVGLASIAEVLWHLVHG